MKPAGPKLMFSPLRYMGSKRSLAPTIAKAISRKHPKAVIVDAFAGTCAVGTALVGNHRVFANDIHAFAEVIAKTLLVTSAPVPLPSEAWEELKPAFSRNVASLEDSISSTLDIETKLLAKLKRGTGWKPLKEFSSRELKEDVPRELPGIGKLSAFQEKPTKLPFHLFSSYFAGAYFGVRQSVEIDSLRCAIESAPNERRDIYLFALLHALSFCSASPGHFAQFLIPRDEENTLYIGRMRRRSIVEYFKNALIELSKPPALNRGGNRVFRSDATEFLRGLGSRRRPADLVIYADPPYSRAQYSRYYHVLETLVLYDYPDASGKGRYRGNRTNTGFSQKAQVLDAFDDFVEAAAATDAPLYLSYPKNGLLYQAGGDMLSILKRHYASAEISASIDLNHSTMGAAPGKAAVQVMEDVYYAKP